MILTDNHNYFISFAGPKADVAFYDTFFATLTTGISLLSIPPTIPIKQVSRHVAGQRIPNGWPSGGCTAFSYVDVSALKRSPTP